MSLTASGRVRTVKTVDPRRQAATDARVEHQADLGATLEQAALRHNLNMMLLNGPGKLREQARYALERSRILGDLT